MGQKSAEKSVGAAETSLCATSTTAQIIRYLADGSGKLMTREQARIEESRLRRARWNRWGPFLSERAWGTVREDYSGDGSAWEYFPHEQARSRAYRWNEDGLLGICDRHQKICFALALWNGRDRILKERLFGLTGNQGNHGEDVKEYYFYLDSTPTHSYMKALYKYPQAAFPYEQLLEENRRRTRNDPEFELGDTGVFRESRYFDVYVEYAKSTPEDILVRILAVNRGPEAAPLDVLPTVWFRNVWSWGGSNGSDSVAKPGMRKVAPGTIELDEAYYGKRWLYFGAAGRIPKLRISQYAAASSGGSPKVPSCCSPRTRPITRDFGECPGRWPT